MTDLDLERLSTALTLAEEAIGVSDPNPRVGCIIAQRDGTIIGRGSTQAAGEGHAEVVALNDALRRGGSLKGSTAWVTLEPCAHFGRTPPCCDALIAAGVARVVIAVGDPNPCVNGKGLERLRAAGIEVVLTTGTIAAQARELNIGFFSRIERGRPWVRLKAAASLDGRTATPNGASRWITSAEARRDGHAWRRRAGAILSGIGTVLVDDPRLDVREFATQVEPLRVIVDTHGRIQPGARVLKPPGQVLIVTGKGARLSHLPADRVEIFQVQGDADGLHLGAVLVELGRRGLNELHVEAGPTLNGSLLRLGLVDEMLLYIAPKMLGPGNPMAHLPSLSSVEAALVFTLFDVARIGPDLRLRLRVPVRA